MNGIHKEIFPSLCNWIFMWFSYLLLQHSKIGIVYEVGAAARVAGTDRRCSCIQTLDPRSGFRIQEHPRSVPATHLAYTKRERR